MASDFARRTAAAVTALLGAVLIALSSKPFSRLLAPDRDDVVVIYVATGLSALLPGMGLFAYALRTLSRGLRFERQLPLVK